MSTKQIHAVLNVVEERILEESTQENLTDAISQELNWLQENGIFVDHWSFADSEKKLGAETPRDQAIEVFNQLKSLRKGEARHVADFMVGIEESSTPDFLQTEDVLYDMAYRLYSCWLQNEFGMTMENIIDTFNKLSTNGFEPFCWKATPVSPVISFDLFAEECREVLLNAPQNVLNYFIACHLFDESIPTLSLEQEDLEPLLQTLEQVQEKFETADYDRDEENVAAGKEDDAKSSLDEMLAHSKKEKHRSHTKQNIEIDR